MRRILIFPISAIAFSAWAEPPWVSTYKLSPDGSRLTISCTGEGPAADIARKIAMDSCRSSAADQLRTDVKVQSKTVETESHAGLHQEVSSDQEFENLNCNPTNQSQEKSDTLYQVWLLCEFNLKTAKVKKSQARDTFMQVQSDSIANRSELVQLRPSGKAKATRDLSSQDQTLLSVSVIPQCSSIMVEGESPRVIPCTENPVRVVLIYGDARLIVRADKHEPKTIQLSQDRKSFDIVEVILNPL